MAIDLVECSNCQTYEHVKLVERLTGTQKKLKCAISGHEWLRGEPARQKIQLPPLEEIKKRFPQPWDVHPEKLTRANELNAEFLRGEPEPVPNVAPYWMRGTSRCSALRAYQKRIHVMLE